MDTALQGVRILDFTQMMLGPFGTQFLGDYGADVIKVERPGVGEWERGLLAMGKLLPDGDSAYFVAMNRNKRSLALNLKSPEAIQLIYEMIPRIDVVVENYRPGVMDKLGLGYEKLSQINPALVYASGTGFGSSGPYLKQPGQDLLIQAISGLAANTGAADDPPTSLGSPVVDASTALMLALHIMFALYHKEKTGHGQRVEVSLFNTAIALQCQELSVFTNLNARWERSETGIGQPWLSAPYGVYPTRDGKWIAIAMASLTEVGDVLGMPELKNYDTPELAFDKRDEIKRLIEACTRQKTRQDLLDKLLAADIWAGPVQDFEEVVNDPQAKHNDLFIEIQRAGDAGPLTLVGFPGKLSGTPASVRYAPPRVGEHTDEVLKEFGVGESQIADLRAKGAVG